MNNQENHQEKQSLSELHQAADTLFAQALARKMQIFSGGHLAKARLAKSLQHHPWRWAFLTTGALFTVKYLARPIINQLPYVLTLTRFGLGLITGEKSKTSTENTPKNPHKNTP